jgi:hypothetical protein
MGITWMTAMCYEETSPNPPKLPNTSILVEGLITMNYFAFTNPGISQV